MRRGEAHLRTGNVGMPRAVRHGVAAPLTEATSSEATAPLPMVDRLRLAFEHLLRSVRDEARLRARATRASRGLLVVGVKSSRW